MASTNNQQGSMLLHRTIGHRTNGSPRTSYLTLTNIYDRPVTMEFITYESTCKALLDFQELIAGLVLLRSAFA